MSPQDLLGWNDVCLLMINISGKTKHKTPCMIEEVAKGEI